MRTAIETLVELRSGRLNESGVDERIDTVKRRRVVCIIGLHYKVFLNEYTDPKRNVFVRSWRCAWCNELFVKEKTVH